MSTNADILRQFRNSPDEPTIEFLEEVADELDRLTDENARMRLALGLDPMIPPEAL